MLKTIKITGILIIIIFASSCTINPGPEYPPVDACFVTDKDNYTTEETVYFNNCSSNASSYEWEFGDGYMSNEKHPSHKYTQAGNYQTRLTAFGNGTHSNHAKTINISGSTKLDILVMYVGTEDPVSNCLVTLYGNLSDWENFENSLVSETTGASGIVIFSDLDPVEYYIDAYREISDTSFYSNELLEVVTAPLTENETNGYNIYVELLYSSKTKDRSNYIIRKIEKAAPDDPRHLHK